LAKKEVLLIVNDRYFNPWRGWSKPTTTNAPIEDEAVQAILGMNQKHILFPAQRFSGPFSTPKISPPTSLLPTSPLLPPSPHFPLIPISRTKESSRP